MFSGFINGIIYYNSMMMHSSVKLHQPPDRSLTAYKVPLIRPHCPGSASQVDLPLFHHQTCSCHRLQKSSNRPCQLVLHWFLLQGQYVDGSFYPI